MLAGPLRRGEERRGGAGQIPEGFGHCVCSITEPPHPPLLSAQTRFYLTLSTKQIPCNPVNLKQHAIWEIKEEGGGTGGREGERERENERGTGGRERGAGRERQGGREGGTGAEST